MNDHRELSKRQLALTVAIVILLLLGIEYYAMVIVNRDQAYRTSEVLIDQVSTILDTTENRKRLYTQYQKENYITKAKAVAFIIDRIPETAMDANALIQLAERVSVDEIHIFDENGVIINSTEAEYIGFAMSMGEQIGYFMPMLSDKTLSMCQDMTPNSARGDPLMYAICWNEAGTQMVQIGVKPYRLIDQFHTSEVSEAIQGMPAYDGIEILVAERQTGEIVGATVESQVGQTLAAIGIDTQAHRPTDRPEHFTITLEGRACYCSMRAAKDHIIAIAQEKDCINRVIPGVVASVFIFLLLAAALIGYIVRRMTLQVLDEQKNANTDMMTGMYNRRAYENALKRMETDARRPELTYVSLDLNGLKQVNDAHGHEAGDELIKGAARYMKRYFGNFGTLYRIGGDEFVALIFISEAQLKRAREDFEVSMASWSRRNGREMSISIGVARAAEIPDKSLSELAKLADSRMYDDKARFYQQSGRDRRRT